jgi:hypothetical protein
VDYFFEEDQSLGAKGFVSAYLHKEDPKMIWIDEANGQGYLDRSQLHAEKEFHLKNLIVSKASQFIAKRMRPGANWGAGITHLEVGTGVGTGTTQAPQPESLTQTQLRTALFRKAISAWTYIDGSGNATGTETNVIEFTVSFTDTEANGALVEMGLFGGDATVTLNSGYMFNYKVFPVWNKANGMQLSVTWRITF